MKDKATIVIRSVGERTEQLCQELILAQGVAPANIVIVREVPFSKAMRKSFEIGLSRGLPWTFCIDADVLLRPGAVEQMVQMAEKHEENICEIQAFILDKFWGGPRQAGNHLYRTSLLDKIITKIPKEGVDIRPEYYTLEAMRKQGYPWATVPCLIGLHDFEQYYRDIFRKCFVQARKHLEHTELFLSFWRENATVDADYRVALKGFARGIEYYDDVFIDVNQEVYAQGFNQLQIKEKDSCLPQYSLDTVEEVIANWSEPILYQKKYPTQMGLRSAPKEQSSVRQKASTQERLLKKIREIGVTRTVLYTVGWLLTRAGNSLCARVKQHV